MVVVVNCKRCGKELRAKDRYAGMATRCPGCDTINQLPSLPSSPPPKMATPPRKPARRKKPWEESESAKPSTSPDTCKICGKPIRGKAERFTDVHGTVYHLGCYQQQAGDAPEDACRICQGGFASEKERVKDVVGFFYHRECYQEELERQRLGASGAKPKEKTDAASKKPTEPKPKPEPEPEEDDWNLTPDPEEDWELDGDVDDGWMRPDQDELEVKDEEPAKPEIKLPAKPVERPTSNRLTRKAESKPRQPAAPAKGSSGASEDPPPEVAKSKPASPRPAPKGASPSKPRQAKPATSESTAGVPRKAAPKAKASSDPKSPKPATSSGATAKKKSTTARAKPLRRAKPIEERPLAALPAKPVEERPLPASPAVPEGLELLPEQDSLPEGLELLPESPGQDGADGLEILDDVPVASPTGGAVPTSPAPAASTPAGVGGLVGLDSLDGLEPLEELEPASGLEPLEGSPFPLAAPSAPTGTGGLDEPVQGILLDPLTGQPATAGPARRSSSENSIPVWLWAVMGVGVGVVLIMLVSSVVSVMWTNEKNSQPIASAGSSEMSDTSEASEAAGDEDYDYEDFDEEGGAYSDVEGGRPPSPDDPPRTLLQMCQRLATRWKAMSGGARAGAVTVVFFVLAIGLALQSLALRVACNMCGEPDVSGNKLVGICVTQMACCFVAGILTVTVDVSVAWIIEIPIRFVICAIVIKTMLPAPGMQSVGITILQWVMMFVIAFLVGLAIVIAVFGIIVAFR